MINQVFPNHLIMDLVTKKKRKMELDKDEDVTNLDLKNLQDLIEERSEHFTLREINLLIETLGRKKKQYQETSKHIQYALLKEFLTKVHRHKRDQLEQLFKEARLIHQDKQTVDQLLSLDGKKLDLNQKSFCEPDSEKGLEELDQQIATIEKTINVSSGTSNETLNSDSCLEITGMTTTSDDQRDSVFYKNKRRKMLNHFDDLEHLYFSLRLREIPARNHQDCYESLEEFRDTLNRFTAYNGFRQIATLCYASDFAQCGSNIVSTIEFDRDNELFAIAGVTKKIKLFDYKSVVRDDIGVAHYPINEMVGRAKISCISWSSYYKSMLASADYEGGVSIWDPLSNARVRQFQEHEKRCWSVDFNKVDTKLLASASDDGRVKLWSINNAHSIETVEVKANVCCVQFNPSIRNQIAFCTADHFVHLYDIRNNKKALTIFKGHQKAVSYVRFLNGEEIVSASTDSQLKLWNINKPSVVMTYQGHLNEKNFVGLAVDGRTDLIACGSEDNALFVYSKKFPKPSLRFSFDGRDQVSQT